MKYFLTAILASLLSLGSDFTPKHLPSVTPPLTGKAYAAGFSVHVTSDVKTPISAGQPFTLEANIVMENGSGEFEFMWWLPEGVQVVSGIEDPTLSFSANGTAQTKITLILSDSNMNYQIVGEAYRFYGSEVQGFTSQFNTNPDALPENQKIAEPKKHKIVQ